MAPTPPLHSGPTSRRVSLENEDTDLAVADLPEGGMARRDSFALSPSPRYFQGFVAPDGAPSIANSEGNEDTEPLFDHDDPETSAPPVKHKSIIAMIGLNSWWISYNMFWFVILIVSMPSQIKEIVGDDSKGSGVSAANFASGIFVLIASPLMGILSDRTTLSIGPRRIWIIVGSLGFIGSLWSSWPTIPIALYVSIYVVLSLSAVVCSVAFNGLVADHTRIEWKGKMSSIMGACQLFGNLLGAGLGLFYSSLGIWPVYLIMTGVMAITLLSTVLAGTEKPLRKVIPTSTVRETFVDMFKPLKDHDFRNVFLSRFFMQLGIATFQQFLQYSLGDCIDLPEGMTETTAVSYVMIPLLALAPISAAAMIPVLRNRRKSVVFVCTAVYLTVCVLMVTIKSFWVMLAVGALFGLAYGPFQAVELALLLDVLPDPNDAARDMATWHQAIVLPQITATPLAGWAVDEIQRIGKEQGLQCLGYDVVYSICIIYFLLGAAFTYMIGRGKKRRIPHGN